MSTSDSLAKRYTVTLRDLHLRDCIMFERYVYLVVYDKVNAVADQEHVQYRQLHHVMTAEKAAQMLQEGQRLAY